MDKYIPDSELNEEEAEYKSMLLEHRKLCFDLENGALKKFNTWQENLKLGRSRIL